MGDPPPEHVSKVVPLAPYQRKTPKQLKTLLLQSLPGCMYGLPFPRYASQISSGEFGAEWFTKALHAAGTLPSDNKVTKVTRAEELNFKGFNKEGGAAMKMFIDVEYEKPDPNLHTHLF